MKTITPKMFKKRESFGAIKIGDYFMWPDREFDDNELGGPFMVTSFKENDFTYRRVDGAKPAEFMSDQYPIADTYLVWYRPQRQIVIIKSK